MEKKYTFCRCMKEKEMICLIKKIGKIEERYKNLVQHFLKFCGKLELMATWPEELFQKCHLEEME